HGTAAGPLLKTIEDMAAWVRAQIGDRPPRTVVLLGHSMGALAALEAAQAPAVCAVVLAGAAAQMPVHPDLLKKARETPEAAAALILKWGVAPAHAAAAEFLKGLLRPETLANDLAACDAYAAGEKTALAMRKPALVLAGEADKLASASAGRALAGMMPDARFCALAGCGHMLMLENAAETAREIKAFAAALEEF
ncbi:MAG: alpha/beta fold hydrolase, partial [Alphaproteobacteria bacterium]|nr:alpha/beta fold hydrolase [Alphaproteobacteria bacterium]